MDCCVCEHQNTIKEFAFPMSITSFSKVIPQGVDVFLCENCGHIFNPPSQLPENFYEETYELLLEDQTSEFVVFKEGQQSTLFDTVLKFVFDHLPDDCFHAPLDILEVGAGKGMLLKRLKETITHPVTLTAVEPNKKSEPYLQHNLAGHTFSMTTLDQAPFKDIIFNLIISHGVLEHVTDPKSFLKGIYNCMNAKSVLYIGVPNFEANPADLVTTDHLSKFTPLTIKHLFNLAGLEIIASHAQENEVFMMFLLKKSPNVSENQMLDSPITVLSSRKNLQKATEYIKTALTAFEDAFLESNRTQKPLSIYGAGNIGLLATHYFKIDSSQINCIYDDNQTFWGTSRMGITVKNPQELSKYPLCIIYISANRCYYSNIMSKINALTHNNASIYPR